MHSKSLVYRPATGWGGDLPAQLDSPNTLVLAFAAPRYAADPAPFDQLSRAFPNSLLIGCSSSGEIAGNDVHDDSVSVAVTRFDHSGLRQASTVVTDAADSFHAGARLAAQLASRELRAVFVLADGLGVNGSALVDGLSRHLGAGVVVTGGLAGDGSAFQRTWVLNGSHGEGRRVSAVGFYGQRLRVGHGCDGGWLDFGPERRITRAEGTVLYELDDKPALALYKTYLGDLAAKLPGSALLFPLSVRLARSGLRPVVRTILGIDEATQSMTFAGDMPHGAIARLMRTSVDRLVGSAEDAIAHALLDLPTSAPVLAVSVSCVGRRLVMGERTDEEAEAVADQLPSGSAHAGFYSYGEIAPANGSAHAELHNQTMTVTVFAEA
jgi:hypothetical protein